MGGQWGGARRTAPCPRTPVPCPRYLPSTYALYPWLDGDSSTATPAQAHTRTRILSVRRAQPRLLLRSRDRARSPVPIVDQMFYTRGQNAATSHRVLSPPRTSCIRPITQGQVGRGCCIRNPSRTTNDGKGCNVCPSCW